LAESLDGGVQVSWDPVDPVSVKQVFIYAGQDRNQLNKVKEVLATKSVAKVSNLENGKKYFFAIAFSNEEVTSLKSALATAMPQAMHASANEFFATPASGQVFLRWSPLKNVDHFEISISANGVDFSETLVVPGISSSAVVGDLINNQKYFFRLFPRDILGNFTGDIFPQIETTPLWDGIRHDQKSAIVDNFIIPANVKNGPGYQSVAIYSFLLAAVLLFFKKSLLALGRKKV